MPFFGKNNGWRRESISGKKQPRCARPQRSKWSVGSTMKVSTNGQQRSERTGYNPLVRHDRPTHLFRQNDNCDWGNAPWRPRLRVKFNFRPNLPAFVFVFGFEIIWITCVLFLKSDLNLQNNVLLKEFCHGWMVEVFEIQQYL
jgi:hypothetical protein